MIGTPEQVRRLRAMKLRAVSLLALAAAIFVGTFSMPDESWVGYVRAASEAAMVGGIADWFAVTALFRYPLGIPIPHTAVLPRSKDAVAAGLGKFITDTFLNPEQLTRRIADLKPAERLANYLSDPEHATAVAGVAAGLLHSLAEAVDDSSVQENIQRLIVDHAIDADLGPALVSFVEHAVDHGHHVPVIDAAIGALQTSVRNAKPTLRDRLREESPWWVPESVDDVVFVRLLQGLDRFLGDVRAEPQHPLRVELDTNIVKQLRALEADGSLSETTGRLRQDLMQHPALQAWISSLWDGAVQAIGRVAEEPTGELRSMVSEPIAQAANRLGSDAELANKLDDWAIRLGGAVADNVGAELSHMIESTVLAWDANETARWVELGVGRDLQIIRINGTVVGGLVGLLIHTGTELFASGRLPT